MHGAMPEPVRSCLDHIAVIAAELARGVEYVADVLGIRPGPGGQHPRMATHNQLLRLGDDCYLEVIAPDPAAAPPGHPRWFGLDELAADASPRLAVWAARCDDIAATARAAAEDLGEIIPLARDALRWSMTVPRDGRLVLGGAAPALLQWHSGGPVAGRLAGAGCALRALDVGHPEPGRVDALLDAIGFERGAVRVSALPAGASPRLIAHIATPHGVRQLGA